MVRVNWSRLGQQGEAVLRKIGLDLIYNFYSLQVNVASLIAYFEIPNVVIITKGTIEIGCCSAMQVRELHRAARCVQMPSVISRERRLVCVWGEVMPSLLPSLLTSPCVMLLLLKFVTLLFKL